MKTTLDLPDDLVKALKLRAVHEGKKLKDAVADTLRAGLAAGKRRSQTRRTPRPTVIEKDRETGLPFIRCRRAAPRGQELTPERVAGLLIDQEAEWTRDAG